MDNLLIIFPSTHNVFLAEDLFNDKEYQYEIISTPDDEEDCCGLSIKINFNNKDEIKKLLNEEFIEYSKINIMNC